MNDNDIKKIGKLIDEKLGDSGKKIAASFNKRLGSTEKRIEARLDERLESTEKRIIKEFVDFVSDNLIPAIDEKADKNDIDRIERKLDYYSSRTLENTHRLDTIESLPTVAHELKLKKKSRS